jgi:hypothetical protein
MAKPAFLFPDVPFLNHELLLVDLDLEDDLDDLDEPLLEDLPPAVTGADVSQDSNMLGGITR